MNRQELNKKVGRIVKMLIAGKGVVAPLEVFLRLGAVSPKRPLRFSKSGDPTMEQRFTTHYVISQDHNK